MMTAKDWPRQFVWLQSCVALLLARQGFVHGSDMQRLHVDLFAKRRNIFRPVCNHSAPLVVEYDPWLTRIVDVNVVEQTMTLDIWLAQSWEDCTWTWDPAEYGGIRYIYLDPKQLWLPDFVVVNTLNGNLEPPLKVAPKVKVRHDGNVTWEYPIIHVVTCQMDVRLFPFDVQRCAMTLFSWTYTGNELILLPKRIVPGANELDIISVGLDLEDYYPNTEWDLLYVPAQKSVLYYPCCPEPFEDMKYYVIVARRPLFYIVTLICPCVVISLAIVFTFLLPIGSGEKISMTLLIFSGLCIFLLLVSSMTPQSAIGIPMLSVYIVFVLLLSFSAIALTVVILNLSKRSPATHVMSPWTRNVFLQKVPRLLRMRVISLSPARMDSGEVIMQSGEEGNSVLKGGSTEAECCDCRIRYRAPPSSNPGYDSKEETGGPGLPGPDPNPDPLIQELLQKGVLGISDIAAHLRKQKTYELKAEDWILLAGVLDRICLLVFALIWLSGTLTFVAMALKHSIYSTPGLPGARD